MLASAPHPLDEGDELEVHALATRVAARVDRLAERPLAPGQCCVAQLSLAEPVLFFPADRLVLRRPAPVNTFAGGTVLDARLRRFRRRDAASLGQLPAVRRDAWPQLLASWVERAGLAAPSAAELAVRLGVQESAVEAPLGRLLNDRLVEPLTTQPRRLVSSAALDGLVKTATAELERRLEGEEVSAGIPARDFAAAVLPRSALAMTNAYLEVLRRRGVLEVAEGRVVPHGSDRFMTEAGAELTRRVEKTYRQDGLQPPAPAEVAERLGQRQAAVDSICTYLVQRGQLVRLEGKFLIHRAVLDEVAQQVREWQADTFAVGQFKDRFGLTRKLAIPILEWLDSERVTVRQGNQRKVLRKRG
jgi:selenocysteine-specific elongation factor